MLEKRLRASDRAGGRAGGQPSERARTKAAVSQSQLQLQRANTTSAAPSSSACGSFAVGPWDVDSSAVRRAIHSIAAFIPTRSEARSRYVHNSVHLSIAI